MENSSLSRLCLESISDNMAMWCECAAKEDFYKYLYVIGPFNNLSPTLMQQLLFLTYDKQLLKCSYFPLLFHENFTRLDLSECHAMITDQVLKLVCRRCQRLTHLNLKGCSRLSNICLNEALPTLQALRSFQISNCRGCTDKLLDQLAKYCRNLQEVVVKSCPKVTDAGIDALLTDKDPGEVSCLEILHLDVSATSVTTKCLEIILTRLPKLRKLCFSNIKADMRNLPKLEDLPALLNVQYLDILETFLTDTNLKLLLDHCPKLAVLKLNCSEILSEYASDQSMGLSNLTSLAVSEGSCASSFQHVEAFLKKRGRQLESLSLFGVHNFRISALCLYCKSLKELVLEHCENLDPRLPTFDDLTKEDSLPEESRGSRLREFCSRLSCIDFSFTTFRDNGMQAELYPVWMSGLLSDHSKLTKLLLSSSEVTDEILRQVCGSSSSLALKSLHLDHCHAITVTSVRGIVENCPNLRMLDLSHCKHVDLASVTQIKKKLKQTGNPLQIVWI